MRPTTHTILLAAIDGDPTVGPSLRQALLRLLSDPEPEADLVTEPEAAHLLGISQAALNAWRNDPSRPFPFTLYPVRNPQGHVYAHRYDRHQLHRHRQADAIPPRQDPQP